MALPAKPAAGAAIESAWGSIVHDAAVAIDIQSGYVDMAFANSAVGPTTLVTFPRPFAAPPVVVCALNVNISVGVQGAISATSCNLQARDIREAAQNGAQRCYWIAIGPRA